MYLLKFIEPHAVGNFLVIELVEYQVYPGIDSFCLLITSNCIRQIPQPELDAGYKCMDLKNMAFVIHCDHY